MGGSFEGALVNFKTSEGNDVEVFTTRPDTIYGVSFVVLAPEHELVGELTSDENRQEVEKYVEAAGRKSERERQGEKEVSGVKLEGVLFILLLVKKFAFIAVEYVLAGYGTGAIMAVPAGDERDWKFAKHMGIEIPSILKDWIVMRKCVLMEVRS